MFHGYSQVSPFEPLKRQVTTKNSRLVFFFFLLRDLLFFRKYSSITTFCLSHVIKTTGKIEVSQGDCGINKDSILMPPWRGGGGGYLG